jgi:glycosyltransferase involved in cell wall biosynthesis
MPFALEQFDLTDYDLVISSESGPAKGVLTNPDALHICYCHTPMRYVWSGYHAYRKRANSVIKIMMPLLLHKIRQWDLASSFRVDHFIANSRNVAMRIRKYYHREASVIYPPVETSGYDPTITSEDFYLLVSQLVPYKGTELAIEAFNRLGRRLVIIGHGADFRKLRRMAGPNVEMLGWQNDAVVREHYARCRALIFAADEDFGMVPVEAMSVGRPVIALRRGGALETVVSERTGVFFDEPAPEALTAAICRFEAIEHLFDRARIAAHAQTFSKAAFKAKMEALLSDHIDAHQRRSMRGIDLLTNSFIAEHPSAVAAE